jgi:hypothetical protein
MAFLFGVSSHPEIKGKQALGLKVFDMTAVMA